MMILSLLLPLYLTPLYHFICFYILPNICTMYKYCSIQPLTLRIKGFLSPVGAVCPHSGLSPDPAGLAKMFLLLLSKERIRTIFSFLYIHIFNMNLLFMIYIL